MTKEISEWINKWISEEVTDWMNECMKVLINDKIIK